MLDLAAIFDDQMAPEPTALAFDGWAFIEWTDAHGRRWESLVAPGIDPDDYGPDALTARQPADAPLPTCHCRCGSTTTVDVTIHNGRSTRRDCARCRRFISFPVWYDRPTEGAT